MRIPSIPNPLATLTLGVFFLTANLANVVYAARDLEPSAGFVFLYSVGVAAVIANWLQTDSRRLGVRHTLDYGWFVFLAWPLALPYHLFKTRGAMGALTLLGLSGLFGATYLVSLCLYFFIR